MEINASTISAVIAFLVAFCGGFKFFVIDNFNQALKNSRERAEAVEENHEQQLEEFKKSMAQYISEIKEQNKMQSKEFKDYIMGYIDEVKRQNGELLAQNMILRERLTADETNTKNGMQRLDVLEKRVNQLLSECRSCRKER